MSINAYKDLGKTMFTNKRGKGEVSAPDSLIAPNSSVRGHSGNGKMVYKENMMGKGDLEDGKEAPGWGSAASGNYEPVTGGTASF
jgi:hypothetical protein